MRDLVSLFSRRERLRRKAAKWFARMRGPLRQQWESDFRAWYARDVANAEAYDRLDHRWQAAAHATDRRKASTSIIARQPRPRLALVATIALAAVSVTVIGLSAFPPFVQSVRATELTFETQNGETRRVTLDDGSRLLLESQSRVRVKFDQIARRVALDRGRVRVDPANDRRPLIVSGDREVTITEAAAFEATMLDGRLTVRPLDGSANAGLGTSIVKQPVTAVRQNDVLEFDGEPLDSAVARANRANPVKIVIADAGLGKERLTGQFRVGDAEGLASSIAAAFALKIEHRSSTVIVLYQLGSLDNVQR
jgi:transmembrane sensor